MEMLEVDVSGFVKKHGWLGIRVEVCVTESSNAVDVNLSAFNGDDLYDIMVATGELTDENEKEAERIADRLAKRYKIPKIYT